MDGPSRVPKDPLPEVDDQVRLGIGRDIGEASHAVHLAMRADEDLVGERSEADGALEQLGLLQFF